MVTIKANQCRKGQILVIDNDLWIVTDYEFRKPGKGSSFNQIKLKKHGTGQQKSMRLSSDETLERAHLDKRPCTFSYMEGEAYVFMDADNYEQYFLESDMVGDTMKFVRDNQQIALTFFESTPVAIDLPTVVVLKVTEAEMSAKGNTVNQDKKRAVCETGLEIKVPPFVDAGEYIKVSTETGEFMSRAKETDL